MLAKFSARFLREILLCTIVACVLMAVVSGIALVVRPPTQQDLMPNVYWALGLIVVILASWLGVHKIDEKYPV